MGFGFRGLTGVDVADESALLEAVDVDVAVGVDLLVAVGVDVAVEPPLEPEPESEPEPEPEPLPESDPAPVPESTLSLTLGEGDSSGLLLGQPAKPKVATRPIAENPITRVRLPTCCFVPMPGSYIARVPWGA
jgi:hypothetical protein